jgi:hypothetical protein
MGSDIFTESAVAVELKTFLNVSAIKKKGVRELITNVLYQEKIIDDESLSTMTKNKGDFIDTFVAEISMGEEGYPIDEERNKFMIETFCLHAGVNLKDLPEWHLRQFDSCRESGYDIMTDVLYIMFEPYDLFETVMTDEGKKVAETLGLDYINETTWTVHSY